MRFRLLLLCLPVLLAACSKTARPVQLDFVGISTLTSGSKTVQPNDTLTTRVYAVGNDNMLKRLRITVTYEPGITPIIYPSPLASYDPTKAPGNKEIIYLDSLIEPKPGITNGRAISEVLFVNQFSARATSGTELWQYTATDVAGATASRAYRLTARKADSAAVFHSFTAVLRPVPRRAAVVARGARDRSRVFLNLQYGLVLPKYAVLNQERSLEANQALVDLFCIANGTGTSVQLVAPANPDTAVCKLPAVWTVRKSTVMHLTTLTSTQFAAATVDDFATGYSSTNAYAPSGLATGALSKGQVIAFKITDGTTERFGLLLISDLVLGSAPVLTCSVRVQK
ncbi:hypothetical protein ACVWYF_003773 [Hymenobacter sp. UYAg731]